MTAEYDNRDTLRVGFEEIYRLTYQKTLAYATRRTSDPADAHDVVSETYLVAWRRRQELLEVTEPLAWLYGVAWRVLLNQQRSQHRRESIVARLGALEEGSTDQGPTASVEARDDLAVVLTALETLPARDQELVRLAAYEELTHSQIGLVLGMRPALVRSRLYRARRKLELATEQARSTRHVGSSGHKQGNGPTTSEWAEGPS